MPRLKPKFADAYFSRGYCYAEKNKNAKAIADWTQCIRLDPKYAKAYYVRSVALARQGEKRKAAEDLALGKQLGFKP